MWSWVLVQVPVPVLVQVQVQVQIVRQVLEASGLADLRPVCCIRCALLCLNSSRRGGVLLLQLLLLLLTAGCVALHTFSAVWRWMNTA